MNSFTNLCTRLVLLGLVVSASTGCRKSPPPTIDPLPVVIDAPSIVCPAPLTADVQQAPAAVQYPAPVVTSGTPPVTSTCTPASGSTFPNGATDITCTATDAISRPAQCVFQVKVNIVAKLKGTKFLAFGDSITAGETGFEGMTALGGGIRLVDTPNSYPTVLAGLLRERYPSR